MTSSSLTDSLRETLALFDSPGAPQTTLEVADQLDIGRRSTYERLERLVDHGELETKKAGTNGRIWWRPQSPSAEQTNDAHGGPPVAESLISDVLDDAAVGVFVLNEEFEVAWINATTEQYFGLDRERVLGRDKRTLVREHIAPMIDDGERFAETVLATYEENTYAERFECTVTTGEGRDERWLEHQSKPIESGVYAGGRVELYYDITERKRTERARQEDRTKFESLVDAVEEYAIFMLDRSGRVQSWNTGAKQIKGYALDEVLGEHVSMFYTEEDREAGVPEANLAAAAEAGSIEAEGWRVRKDGSRFWASVTITAIHDDDGDLTGFAKVTQDLTDRRERERQLRRERDLNDRLFDTAPVRLAVFDTDGSIKRMNSRAQQELGVDASDGQILESIMLLDADGKPLSANEHPVQHVIETADPVSNVEVQHETPTGERRWASLTASPLFDEDGELDRVIVAGKDITELKQTERQLERQRDELRHELDEIYQRIADAFHALDTDFRFTHLNEHAEELLGTTEEEIYGEYIWDAFPRAAERSYKERYERAMKTQEPLSFEEYSDAADAWLEVRIYPSETGLSVYFTDITERKERERKLKQYEQIVETIWDGVYALDEDDRFVLVNEAFCDLVGYDRDELLGEHPTLINSEAVNEAANELETEVTAGSREVGILEVELQTADGETVPVETRFGPYEYGDGRIGRCGVSRDISERKEYEQELEKRAQQQQAVADLGQLALETDDLDELMDDASRRVASVLDTAYCKVLDLDEENEELLLRQGAGWMDGIVGETTVSAVEADSQAAYTLAKDHPIVIEDFETDTRFSGPELLTSHDVRSGISTSIGPFSEPWGILGTHDTESKSFTDEDVNFVQSVANVLADAIERQQYQTELETLVADLEESNERLEQFAYIASHDLQEPLRMVSSYLQLLEQRYGDALDEDGEEFLEFAVDGAERMREMIDGLLDYSRVETRGEPFEPVDLSDALEAVRADLRFQIEETDAEITTEDLPRVEGDASQLRQVFQNLLSNALAYSGDEPPRVHVEAERRRDEWVISIRDEGIGMEPDDQERIFEVFQRLHSHEEHDGTGIGLALCERIVERHGGEIWVESEPSEGSTFSFTLPT